MRFLGDMGVSQRVVEWLRENGHDIVHLRDEGLHRLPNGAIFEKAEREERIVLTFDLDFGEIVASKRAAQPSVVIFRLHNTRSHSIISRLQAVLLASQQALEEGVVVIVEDARHRIRRLPIGG